MARLAALQLGLVSREQAVAAGATDRMIQHRVVTGQWIRVGPGVYRLAGAPVTWHQRALAACMVAGAGAVVSHRSAAVLWGVSGFRPGPLDITVPRGRSNRNALATVHRSACPSAADCTTRERVPVTRPPRLLVDLAGRVSPQLLEEAVDDVFCRRLTTHAAILGRIAQSHHRGTQALRRIVAAWNDDGLPANVAEMRIVRLLLASGLPQPVRQHEIWGDGGFVARVDLAYPEHRLAIELDSFRWHAGRGPFRGDRVRGNRMAAVGWRVLRATPEDAGDGADLVRAAGRMLSVAA